MAPFEVGAVRLLSRHSHVQCAFEQHNVVHCRDGSNDNFSWNCGVEGETDDEKVNALRQSQMRNMHMALMLSQGTPMVLMGKLPGLSYQLIILQQQAGT